MILRLRKNLNNLLGIDRPGFRESMLRREYYFVWLLACLRLLQTMYTNKAIPAKIILGSHHTSQRMSDGLS
jgi:hypothetical protein